MSKNENGSKIYLYGLCSVAVIGGLLFGYDTAVISGGEQSLQKFFGMEGSPTKELLHGLIVSSALVGCIIGAILSGVLSNRLGRRNSLIVAAILFFLSALGSYMPEFLFRSDFSLYSPQEGVKSTALKWAFVFYRVLGGVGVGLASAICPMYIAEISPAEIRGTLVSWNQFAIIFGQLLVYAINAVIRSNLGKNEDEIKSEMIRVGWRRMFVSEAVPAFLFGVLLLLVPKTPRFLVMRDNCEKAEQILTRINGREKAQDILQEIKDTLEEKKEKLLSYGFICVLVGCLLSFFQQAVGINVVLYYAPRIFEKMGSSGNAAMIQTVVMGFVNIVFTVLAIFTVDKWGRKPLLMIGSCGMAFGMIAMSCLCYFGKNESKSALIFIIIYTASFMMSWGPVCWVMISEIFPNTIRSNAVAWAVAVQWISNFIVSFTFPYLCKLSNTFAYLMYGIFSILSAIFVFTLVPETKGKTLEDMTELWRSKMRGKVNKDVMV